MKSHLPDVWLEDLPWQSNATETHEFVFIGRRGSVVDYPFARRDCILLNRLANNTYTAVNFFYWY